MDNDQQQIKERQEGWVQQANIPAMAIETLRKITSATSLADAMSMANEALREIDSAPRVLAVDRLFPDALYTLRAYGTPDPEYAVTTVTEMGEAIRDHQRRIKDLSLYTVQFLGSDDAKSFIDEVL